MAEWKQRKRVDTGMSNLFGRKINKKTPWMYYWFVCKFIWFPISQTYFCAQYNRNVLLLIIKPKT